MTPFLKRTGPLLSIALAGWWLRAGPLFGTNGVFGVPVDYDEGVYFTASALFARGDVPYRDFVLVHPPGWPMLLAPVAGPLAALAGIRRAFAAARFAATVVGALNIVLVGLVGRRLGGWVAGPAAAALYATYPEVVVVERGAFMEPVLNLFVLAGAWCWLRPGRGEDGYPDRATGAPLAVAAGALVAAACVVKTWGAFALAGMIASLPIGLPSVALRRVIARVALGGLMLAAVALAPFLILAPGEFVEQVVEFQLQRPPDGAPPGDRPALLFEPLAMRNGSDLFAATHPASAVAAVAGAALALARILRREARGERFVVVMLATMLVVFMTGRSFYTQYHAHLAVPETLLGGYAAGVAWNALARCPRRSARAIGAVTLAGLPLLGARQAVLIGRARTHELVEVGAFVRSNVATDACIFAFEPATALVGGRIPAISDPYAATLLPAVDDGESYPRVDAGFEAPASQVDVVAVLRRCEWVVYGPRGRWQSSAETEAWFEATFVRVHPSPGVPGIDVWRNSGESEDHASG